MCSSDLFHCLFSPLASLRRVFTTTHSAYLSHGYSPYNRSAMPRCRDHGQCPSAMGNSYPGHLPLGSSSDRRSARPTTDRLCGRYLARTADPAGLSISARDKSRYCPVLRCIDDPAAAHSSCTYRQFRTRVWQWGRGPSRQAEQLGGSRVLFPANGCGLHAP